MHNFAFFVRKTEYLCMFFLELWKKYCSFVGEWEGGVFLLIRLIYKKLQQNNKRNQQYMKKVFVSGCYDLLHSGHVEFFRQASQFGELYVGIGSDQTILGYKHHKTFYPEQ